MSGAQKITKEWAERGDEARKGREKFNSSTVLLTDKEEEGKEAKIEVIVEIKPNKVKRASGTTRKQSKEANKSKTRCKAQIESANK